MIESNSLKEIKLAASSTKTKIQNKTTSTTKKETKTRNFADKDTTAIKQAVKSLSEKQKMVLMSNEKIVIESSKTDLYLDIWDGAYVDGDSISIYLNNKILQENIHLTKTRKTIKLPTKKESLRLTIVALNIGQRGANSVSYELKEKDNAIQFISKLNKGESFNIEILIK